MQVEISSKVFHHLNKLWVTLTVNTAINNQHDYMLITPT